MKMTTFTAFSEKTSTFITKKKNKFDYIISQ